MQKKINNKTSGDSEPDSDVDNDGWEGDDGWDNFDESLSNDSKPTSAPIPKTQTTHLQTPSFSQTSPVSTTTKGVKPQLIPEPQKPQLLVAKVTTEEPTDKWRADDEPKGGWGDSDDEGWEDFSVDDSSKKTRIDTAKSKKDTKKK